MLKKIKSFSYSASKDAKILILGSMPGEESLRQQQYYAHPRNLFWEFMGDMFGFDKSIPYSMRLEKLKQNKIALWDVVYQCKRPGSLDSEIKISTTEPNDFVSFFEKYKGIKTVFFNGKKAEALFKRFIIKKNLLINYNLSFYQLPSTSPANASITREIKIKEWSKILNVFSDNMLS